METRLTDRIHVFAKTQKGQNRSCLSVHTHTLVLPIQPCMTFCSHCCVKQTLCLQKQSKCHQINVFRLQWSNTITSFQNITYRLPLRPYILPMPGSQAVCWCIIYLCESQNIGTSGPCVLLKGIELEVNFNGGVFLKQENLIKYACVKSSAKRLCAFIFVGLLFFVASCLTCILSLSLIAGVWTGN